MKKIYVLLFVTAGIILSAKAQPFEKGDKLLGGSLYFAHGDNSLSINQSDSKYNSIGVSPAFGVFTKQNQLMGILLSYQYNGSTANSTPQTKSSSYGAGIYKQYWSSLANKFYFIVQGQLTANYNYNKNTIPQQGGVSKREQKNYNANFSIDPGFAYRIKKRLILDLYYSNFLRTGYTYSTYKEINPGSANITSKGNNYVFDTGLRNFSLDNFRFGFRYVL